MSIVLPHSEEFSFEGVSVDTYFTFRHTTTGTCGFSGKTSKFYLAMFEPSMKIQKAAEEIQES
jgi:hypothetical protein